MKHLIAAAAITLAAILPATAGHKAAEGPTTYLWAACSDLATTDRLVEIVVDPATDPNNIELPIGCIAVNVIARDDREHYPIVIGPLADVMGNHFTVHEVLQNSGATVYLFVFTLAELRAKKMKV